MKFLICLAICLCLGCATTPPPPPPVTAIVSACPQPPELARPLLMLRELKPTDAETMTQEQLIDRIIKAYTVSLAQLMSYTKYLEEIIEGYRVNREL